MNISARHPKWSSLKVWTIAILALMVLRAFLPLQDPEIDPDWWWHLSYGQKILADGIPRTEWLLWPYVGQPYTVSQWLGEASLAWSHLHFGTLGPRALALLSIAAALILLMQSIRRSFQSETFALLVVLAGTLPLWSAVARPQVLAFGIFAAVVALLEADQHLNRKRTWLGLVGLMAIWANVHASFVAGIAYVALVSGTTMLDLRLAGARSAANGLLIKTTALIPAMAAATLLTPFGLDTWQPLLITGNAWSTKTGVIAEWQFTAMGTPLGEDFFSVVFALVVALALGKAKLTWGQVARLVLIAAFGFGALRQTFFASIALVPLLARCCAQSSLDSLLASRLPSRVHAGFAVAVLATCATLGYAMSHYYERTRVVNYERLFPVAALDYVHRNDLQGRMWNEITAGGWLGFHSRLQPYIDGRTDLFRDKEYFDWFFTRQGAPSWEQSLARRDPEIFIIQNQSPLRQLLLASSKYALVHEDATYSVVLAQRPQFAQAIGRDRKSPRAFTPINEQGQLTATLLGF